MGGPASHRISRVRRYSRSCIIARSRLRLRDSHPLRSPVPATFGSASALQRGPCRFLHASRSTPHQQRRQPRTLMWFRLLPVRSPLLRESSLFLGVREMFQFPRFPPRPERRRSLVSPRGVAPFGHHRITDCQRLPGAFRRVAASFIGLLRLGIHHVLFFGSSPVSRSFPGVTLVRGARGGAYATTRPAYPVDLPLQFSMCHMCPPWSRGDSNPGPPPCKGGALPTKLRPLLSNPGVAAGFGGRAWTRTRDLGLIRAAL